MNILVLSDSHGAIAPIRRLLDTYANQIRLAVHLGDYAGDLLQLQSQYPGYEMAAVAGNCDYGIAEGDVRMLNIAGKKILLTHGHQHIVKMSYDRLMYFAEENDADACLFGHTHEPVIFEHGKCTFLNPGSLGRPHDGFPATYGLLFISDTGVITAKTLPCPA